jgi:hypothetical protein
MFPCIGKTKAMAATSLRSSCLRILNVNNNKVLLRNITQTRNVVTKTGAILEAPPKRGFRGVLGAAAAIFTGVTVGSVISKDMASFLEENDLFVPSDDDDD